MIGVSVPTLVLIYGHQKVGSISAASIGVISIVLSYILYGFFPIALIENMIVVGLAYLEYRRVKAIEDFKPSNETDEQTTTDN